MFKILHINEFELYENKYDGEIIFLWIVLTQPYFETETCDLSFCNLFCDTNALLKSLIMFTQPNAQETIWFTSFPSIKGPDSLQKTSYFIGFKNNWVGHKKVLNAKKFSVSSTTG